jgi:hypothetical protein
MAFLVAHSSKFEVIGHGILGKAVIQSIAI